MNSKFLRPGIFISSEEIEKMPTAWLVAFDALMSELYASQSLLSRSIDDLDPPSRARVIFHDLGIKTIGDLISWSTRDLLRNRNLGNKTLNEIEMNLAELGLKLRQHERRKK